MRSSGSASPVSRIRWRRGRVTATGRTGRDTLQLTVEVPDEGALPALAYPSLVGTPQVGDDVLLNTTALAQGLGTGGVAMVVAVPDRLPPDPEGPGHLVKARYTPLQVTVSGVDERTPSTTRCSPRPTTSTACRSWWPTCTRRCPRS